MKIAFGSIVRLDNWPDLVRRLNELMRNIERAFDRVPEDARRVYEKTLNFAAPGAVPGVTEQTVTIDGVEVGDTVVVGSPVAVPAGFVPPVGYVSATDTVKIVWLQVSGVAADPDGGGGLYRINVWRH